MNILKKRNEEMAEAGYRKLGHTTDWTMVNEITRDLSAKYPELIWSREPGYTTLYYWIKGRSAVYEDAQDALEGIRVITDRLSGVLGDNNFTKQRAKVLKEIRDQLSTMCERCEREDA